MVTSTPSKFNELILFTLFSTLYPAPSKENAVPIFIVVFAPVHLVQGYLTGILFS